MAMHWTGRFFIDDMPNPKFGFGVRGLLIPDRPVVDCRCAKQVGFAIAIEVADADVASFFDVLVDEPLLPFLIETVRTGIFEPGEMMAVPR